MRHERMLRRETAFRWLELGRIKFTGRIDSDGGHHYWEFTQIKDYPGERFVLKIPPGEPLLGCLACGKVVEPRHIDGNKVCPCGAVSPYS